MGVIWSNSSLFSTPGFIVSPVGKGEIRTKRKQKGRREKENRKGMEGRKGGMREEGIKKDWRKHKKKEF